MSVNLSCETPIAHSLYLLSKCAILADFLEGYVILRLCVSIYIVCLIEEMCYGGSDGFA